MFGVYAKSDSVKMHLIMSDLSPAESFEGGMIYTEEEALIIANKWSAETGGSAFIAKDD